MTLICPGSRAPCPNGAECPHASGWYHCSVHLPVDWSKVRVLEAERPIPPPGAPSPTVTMFVLGWLAGLASSVAIYWGVLVILGQGTGPT